MQIIAALGRGLEKTTQGAIMIRSSTKQKELVSLGKEQNVFLKFTLAHTHMPQAPISPNQVSEE